ncbi:hypothetical protein GCM10018780_54880 [Streptomyces lanatus]|nr:hypothetical protein GCM10018780_54880 [Streptomyces lanatus]
MPAERTREHTAPLAAARRRRLRAEQLVERLPGVGTVVVAEKHSHGLDRLMGLAETLREQGRVTNEVRTMGAPSPRPHPWPSDCGCAAAPRCTTSSGSAS